MLMRSLRFGSGVALVLAAVVATACQTASPVGEATDIRGPVLDLETLEAVTPEGVFRGEPLSDASVGAVDDDWFIGISTPDGTEAGVVVAYLCDGVRGIWLEGEISDGAASLQAGATVLEFEGDGTFTGTVAIDGGEAQAFTAVEAAGDAGLFRAIHVSEPASSRAQSVGTLAYTGGWIILNATSMRGSIWWFEDEEPTDME
jgi:hypothetical protein